MKHLMIIGVGPVQEFIASARRSRDLWFGSWLLSELSKAAARAVVGDHAKDLNRLIFPSVKRLEDLEENSEFNVVNKIVALVDDPQRTSVVIWLAMQERLDRIREYAYEEITGDFDEPKAKKQVDDLTDFFWAAAQIDNPQDEDEYQAARKQAEYLFAARKNTRNFKAVAWGMNVPKSSLDGHRESVIDESVYNNDAVPKEELWKRYGVRQGERLCGVGLLKRHGNRGNDNSFFSTSHVAALPLLRALTAEHETAVRIYIETIKGLLKVGEKDLRKFIGHVPKGLAHPIFKDYDGHLLFEERLNDFFTDKHDLQEAKKALREFLDRAFAEKKPLPYYALLLGDGDHMSKAIDAQAGIEKHQGLSLKLSEFAKEVRGIVEGYHNGSLVYSGGDDVMAFVPLHTVLDCAKDLANSFSRRLAGFAGHSPTLSVGIAVVHHLEPLSDALELARRAEKKAKAVDGKNALAVVVDKRSGASRIAAGTWGALDEHLQKMIKWHYHEDLPDNAVYQLRDLAIRLESSKTDSKKEKGILDKARRLEAIRILKRKRAAYGQEEIKQEIIAELTRWLKHEELSDDENRHRIEVGELADELIIAKVFADAKKLANLEAENG